jgi:hypothetical protein
VAALSAEQDRLCTSFRDPPPSAPGTLAPAPEIPASAPQTAGRKAGPPPEAILYSPSAGTIAASEHERKSVPHPAPTTSREADAADIMGGTCLLYNDRPPLRYGQI